MKHPANMTADENDLKLLTRTPASIVMARCAEVQEILGTLK
jgi:hypothetical protein